MYVVPIILVNLLPLIRSHPVVINLPVRHAQSKLKVYYNDDNPRSDFNPFSKGHNSTVIAYPEIVKVLYNYEEPIPEFNPFLDAKESETIDQSTIPKNVSRDAETSTKEENVFKTKATTTIKPVTILTTSEEGMKKNKTDVKGDVDDDDYLSVVTEGNLSLVKTTAIENLPEGSGSGYGVDDDDKNNDVEIISTLTPTRNDFTFEENEPPAELVHPATKQQVGATQSTQKIITEVYDKVTTEITTENQKPFTTKAPLSTIRDKPSVITEGSGFGDDDEEEITEAETAVSRIISPETTKLSDNKNDFIFEIISRAITTETSDLKIQKTITTEAPLLPTSKTEIGEGSGSGDDDEDMIFEDDKDERDDLKTKTQKPATTNAPTPTKKVEISEGSGFGDDEETTEEGEATIVTRITIEENIESTEKSKENEYDEYDDEGTTPKEDFIFDEENNSINNNPTKKTNDFTYEIASTSITTERSDFKADDKGERHDLATKIQKLTTINARLSTRKTEIEEGSGFADDEDEEETTEADESIIVIRITTSEIDENTISSRTRKPTEKDDLLKPTTSATEKEIKENIQYEGKEGTEISSTLGPVFTFKEGEDLITLSTSSLGDVNESVDLEKTPKITTVDRNDEEETSEIKLNFENDFDYLIAEEKRKTDKHQSGTELEEGESKFLKENSKKEWEYVEGLTHPSLAKETEKPSSTDINITNTTKPEEVSTIRNQYHSTQNIFSRKEVVTIVIEDDEVPSGEEVSSGSGSGGIYDDYYID